MAQKICVVGAGGIGGIVSALLLETGHDVVTVTKNGTIADSLRKHGFQLRGDDAGARAVPANVAAVMPRNGSFDVVILATQPPDVERAAEEARAVLAADGRVVCLQNGLCEDRVAKIVGEDRVLGAVVAWGGTMPEPGVYDRTAQGGFTLGRMDGKTDDRMTAIASALECIGPVEITGNLQGKRWSKLAINCAISSLGTLGGDRLGALMPLRHVRRLALEIMTEVVRVAHAERVKLEKVSGTVDLDWIALTEDDQVAAGSPSLVAKHALLLAVGFRYRRMRSSMLSAIERGRVPAVDFLNGEIVERAKAHEIAVPVNAQIQRMVWELARKERTPGIGTLQDLFDQTGPH